MSDISCPHCGAMNPAGMAFCETCGKALPSGTGGGPRVVPAGEIAMSEAGLSLQADDLKSRSNAACTALLAVALLQFVFGLFAYFTVRMLADEPRSEIDPSLPNTVLVVVLIISGVYLGLWFWAKSSPFPAALSGLILFVTMWVGSFIMDPGTQLNVIAILVNLIILIVLVRAVKAGLEYRKLQAEADGRLG